MSDESWAALVERAGLILREVARSAGPGTITYADLRVRLGADEPLPGGRELASLLRAVSVAEDDAGRPLLSAVVVRRSGRPGPGWFRLAAERGRDMSDPEQAWAAEMARIRGA